MTLSEDDVMDSIRMLSAEEDNISYFPYLNTIYNEISLAGGGWIMKRKLKSGYDFSQQ